MSILFLDDEDTEAASTEPWLLDLHFAPCHWLGLPDLGPLHFAANHWANTTTGIPPISPGGAGIFQLALEEEAIVTFIWKTGIAKFHGGLEKRASFNADPTVKYSGQAILVDSDVRVIRSQLALFAAQGSAFLLGLPYEEMTGRAASTQYTVYVEAEALSMADWAVPGARALIKSLRYGSLEVTVQSKTADSILIDVPNGEPIGNVGRLPFVIMPAVSIFLEAQQAFSRYARTTNDGNDLAPLERWQIDARLANNGFAQAAAKAELELGEFYELFDGLTVQARAAGEAGNLIQFSMFGGGGDPLGNLYDNENDVEFQYQTSVTTIADLINTINASVYVRVVGTVPDPSLVIGPDHFIDNELLSGGADEAPAPAGIGVSLTTYRGKQIWDRGIDGAAGIVDSINSMAQPRDLGALPFTSQTVEKPDWGRQVKMRRNLGEPFQWAKLFVYTARGAFHSWWLPTWRQDLLPVSVGTGTLTVASTAVGGDFATWYPRLREHLMVVESDGETETFVRIASAVDNFDGTITLTIVDENDDPVTFADVVEIDMLSWLELVRFERDEFPFSFTGGKFSINWQCRAVQQ